MVRITITDNMCQMSGDTRDILHALAIAMAKMLSSNAKPGMGNEELAYVAKSAVMTALQNLDKVSKTIMESSTNTDMAEEMIRRYVAERELERGEEE